MNQSTNYSISYSTRSEYKKIKGRRTTRCRFDSCPFHLSLCFHVFRLICRSRARSKFMVDFFFLFYKTVLNGETLTALWGEEFQQFAERASVVGVDCCHLGLKRHVGWQVGQRHLDWGRVASSFLRFVSHYDFHLFLFAEAFVSDPVAKLEEEEI